MITGRKVVASIEARMTSTRLPGKVLKPCLGRPMLDLMIERLRRSRTIDAIVIATTINATDDPVAALAEQLGVHVYRGSEHDVVQRVVDAHRASGSDVVVQLTGDCPLIDPEVVDALVRFYAMNRFDYVGNAIVRSYPIGLDTQVSSLKVLEDSLTLAKTADDHEHLYKTIYTRPDRFSLHHMICRPELMRPELRITLDTAEDYRVISGIFEALYPGNPAFGTADVIALVDRRPDLMLTHSPRPLDA